MVVYLAFTILELQYSMWLILKLWSRFLLLILIISLTGVFLFQIIYFISNVNSFNLEIDKKQECI